MEIREREGGREGAKRYLEDESQALLPQARGVVDIGGV